MSSSTLVTLPSGHSIGIRHGAEQDWPFILHSWMSQIRNESPFWAFNPEEFREHKDKIVDRIAEQADCLVVHSATDVDHLYGYCVYATDVLYAIYVRGGDRGTSLRGYGIGKTLLSLAFPELGKQAVWIAYDAQGARWMRNKYNMKYNPYVVWDAK